MNSHLFPGLYQVSGSTVELPMVAQRAAQQAASFATVAEMQEPIFGAWWFFQEI